MIAAPSVTGERKRQSKFAWLGCDNFLAANNKND
jgi:hypothetical protein